MNRDAQPADKDPSGERPEAALAEAILTARCPTAPGVFVNPSADTVVVYMNRDPFFVRRVSPNLLLHIAMKEGEATERVVGAQVTGAFDVVPDIEGIKVEMQGDYRNACPRPFNVSAFRLSFLTAATDSSVESPDEIVEQASELFESVLKVEEAFVF